MFCLFFRSRSECHLQHVQYTYICNGWRRFTVCRTCSIQHYRHPAATACLFRNTLRWDVNVPVQIHLEMHVLSHFVSVRPFGLLVGRLTLHSAMSFRASVHPPIVNSYFYMSSETKNLTERNPWTIPVTVSVKCLLWIRIWFEPWRPFWKYPFFLCISWILCNAKPLVSFSVNQCFHVYLCINS